MPKAKLTKKQVEPIFSLMPCSDIKEEFKAYRGRRFILDVQANYYLNNGDLVWDGGSKMDVTFIRNVEGRLEVVDAATAIANPMKEAQTVSTKIPPNIMIVERSFFCGKDMGFRFIVAPQSAFLPSALQITEIAGLLI